MKIIEEQDRLKVEMGITLVALIITIIILIILAAVSVNAVFKANFIGIATNGAINYAGAQTDEEEKFENLNSKLEDVIEKIAKYKAEENKNEEEIKYTQEEKEAMIGKTIEYKPSQMTYTADKKYTGSTADQSFATEELAWKIWKIDDEKVMLISEKPTTAKLTLVGELGYNNGVKILNDICSKCYGNEELRIVARNLNLDDIESVLDKSVWKPEDDYYTNTSTPGKQASSNGTGIYHMLTETCKNTNNKNYPYIWQYEAYSNIDGKKVLEGGLRRSEQNELYEVGHGTTNSYYELMYNGWFKRLKSENFINPIYENLIIKDASGNYYDPYLLSSRMTFPGEDSGYSSYVLNRFFIARCG